MMRPQLKLPNGRFKKATMHYNNKRLPITATVNQLIWSNWKQEKEVFNRSCKSNNFNYYNGQIN